MKESFVFSYKTYVFSVQKDRGWHFVRIRQATGTHVWTVSVNAPRGVSRWDLAEAALTAWKDGLDEVDL